MSQSEMVNETPAAGMNYFQRAIAVIARPADYFRTMPRSGGFADPLIFIIVIALINGVLSAIRSFVLVHSAAFGAMALVAGLVIAPAVVAIGSFIGAGIAFVIWRILGSRENYETAYRCTAACYAISPITLLVGFIPYGGLVGIAWGLYLGVVASVEVHGISARKAWVGFGVLAALLAFSYLGAQRAAHRARTSLGSYSQQLNKFNFNTDALKKQLDQMPKQGQ